jgi:hypothetical protein
MEFVIHEYGSWSGWNVNVNQSDEADDPRIATCLGDV